MSFTTTAEELVVLEPMEQPAMTHGVHTKNHMHSFMPEHLSHPHSHHGQDHDHHGHGHGLDEHDDSVLVINDPQTVKIDIVLEELPGAGDDIPEIPIVVEDEEPKLDKKEEITDENDARKSKKSDKWDWESKGASGFVSWIKERIDTVPRHSGMDTAGLERAISYLERLDTEISKAMRLDLEGDLDANKIEEVRSKIDDGLARLHERLDKVKKSKKGYKKKKAEFLSEPGLVKEAQKITGVQGIYVTVPLLISRVARVCINGTVSAGHDIEDLYNRQVKFYKLSTREQAEVMQLLADMGYPVRQDRGFMPEDALEISDSDGMDWAANFKG